MGCIICTKIEKIIKFKNWNKNLLGMLLKIFRTKEVIFENTFKSFYFIILLCWFTNWILYMKGKERWKKEADYSRLVDVSFNKQRTYILKIFISFGHMMWLVGS